MKRHNSLFVLSYDHQHGLALSIKLKYSKHPLSSSLPEEVTALKAGLADAFETKLRKHFSLEEKYLVPLFPDNAMLNRMLDEHRKLEGLYSKILENHGNPDLKQQREKLNLFGELLELHIRFEERELFPMIEQNLSEEQLIKLGENLNKEP